MKKRNYDYLLYNLLLIQTIKHHIRYFTYSELSLLGKSIIVEYDRRKKHD